MVDAVLTLTHRTGEPLEEYYARVRADPLALKVLLADLAVTTDPARMADLDEPTRRRLAAEYETALAALT